MIGINNRNLGTFFTDVENSFRLAGQLPQDAVLVSRVAFPIRSGKTSSDCRIPGIPSSERHL